MSDGCIFCKIADKTVPCDLILETEDCLVFRDIAPTVKVHLLAIPKRHLSSLADAGPEDASLLANTMDAARQAAAAVGIADSGYRVVCNVGRDGGQAVGHIHFHILGGQRLGWPAHK